MIENIGPWVGLVSGAFAMITYLTMVIQVKTKLDMFIAEQIRFRVEIISDLDKLGERLDSDLDHLGQRLERAIDRITDNRYSTAKIDGRLRGIELKLGVIDGGSGE